MVKRAKITRRVLNELPHEITFDQWAESGGTAGIFAKGVRTGKIKITDMDS